MLTAERKPLEFEWLPLPEGRQPLPDWLIGAHVEWMDRYANAPGVHLKTTTDVREWEGKAWIEEGERTLVARHPDGRVHRYGFDGGLVERDVRVFNGSGYEMRRELASQQSDGHGGSWTHCVMGEGPHAGKTAILRGPWGIGAPPGYVDVSYAPRPANGWPSGSPWYRGGGLAGLGISLDLYLRAVARFLPHCRVARILGRSYGTIEIADGAWDEPKTIRLDWQAIAYTRRGTSVR